MLRLLLAAALFMLLLPVAPSHAQTARQAREQVEASMLVTGLVDIDREGRVTAHTIDQPDALPGYVLDLIEQAVPGFQFEPLLVDGAPSAAQAKMRMRLVATQDSQGGMNVAIRSAHFGEAYSDSDAGNVRRGKFGPPRYPERALHAGGTGTVYLLVRVGRDGRVEDVAAEQVNLTVLGTAREMDAIRQSLARASVAAARRWSFIPPTEGVEATKERWVVRVPVNFNMSGADKPAYGQWSAYHPGPRTRPDWAQATPRGFSPDVLLAGEPTPEATRFRLLTPLEG